MAFDAGKLRTLVCSAGSTAEVLFFNADYDNRRLRRDQIELLCYVGDKEFKTTLIEDEAVFSPWNNAGEKFDNEKKLSNFEINKRELCPLLEKFPRAKYVLLRSVPPATDDDKYERTVRYEVRIINTDAVPKKRNKMYTIADSEETGLFLNPSPPARPNYFNEEN